MQIDRVLSKYQLVPLRFAQVDVADSQTAAPLAVAEAGAAGLANTGYTMPFPGWVIGISCDLDAAATAGSLAIVPTIDTVACTDPALTVTTGTGGSDTCGRITNPFDRGSVIGAAITTSGDWNGTTSDLMVMVWVALGVEGI